MRRVRDGEGTPKACPHTLKSFLKDFRAPSEAFDSTMQGLPLRMRHPALRIAGLLSGLLLPLLALTLWPSSPSVEATGGFSLRFYGNGGGDIDRVKILVEGRSINVGGDFTLEWWMKATRDENASSECMSSEGDLWIYGNILFDRDVFGAGDYGDYGISLAGGRIAFGVNRGGNGFTLCGTREVADGRWHHIAVTRRGSDGWMRIFVDGELDAEGRGPSGDIRYRDGRPTDYSNDPYLVIGAEKHDFDRSTYPSYSGWVDEVRLSRIVRYDGPFSPPTAPFMPDTYTLALYHFDEGPEGPCTGTVIDAMGVNHGQCRYGSVDSRTPGPVYSTNTPFGTIAPPSILSGPVLFALATTAVVSWTTDVEATSEVRWGVSCNTWAQSRQDPGLTRSHVLVLDGLNPSTSYCLQVRSVNSGGGTLWTPETGLSFTTRVVEFRVYLPLVRK